MVAAQFLRNFIARLPYRIHTILTPSHGLQENHCRAVDNAIQFTNRKQDTTAFENIFDRVCQENGIDHRLTKIAHPSRACKHALPGNAWTNGQVERMNRTLSETLHNQLKTHLSDFVDAYNYARRLKTLNGLTPFEYICKTWTSEPERFKVNPTHHKPGLNT